ncbi:hypothetical protein BKA67DRAFT_657776 [Truncatella angustata]|uniref:Berberine/berberine-like domain-containing protein n=1 Tax=Truncatella angustata TaxID=152316 RepID=A0A9P8UP60_9PEZI|nr:uncharacterized protein BKA67DRAFT_657776 [Truncatella angustata]KAH6655876.1 hypothetical protein BKA67DRAFT_657776 [Truncatella angustata]
MFTLFSTFTKYSLAWYRQMIDCWDNPAPKINGGATATMTAVARTFQKCTMTFLTASIAIHKHFVLTSPTGRSVGSYALSIWVHNLRNFEYQSQWPLPGGGFDDVIIVGSGSNWGEVMEAAAAAGRSCATVVTTSGEILLANDQENQDLLWAIRGGGPGLYGVVTDTAYNTSWIGLSAFMKSLPDSMDAGLTGSAYISGGSAIGASFVMTYFRYNMTSDNITSLLEPVVTTMKAVDSNNDLAVSLSDPIVYSSYMDFFYYLQTTASGAGAASLISSRILGRADLSDLSNSKLQNHLQNIMQTNTEGGASQMIIGLQWGMGPAQVAFNMRGALNPAWRTGYVHTIVTDYPIDTTLAPQDALNAAAVWTEEVKEADFRDWAPTAGAYLNEANPFASSWKQDFYGENYDRLLELKDNYDTTYSLYVTAGVGSDSWDYNLTTGKLCCKA